MSKLRSVNTHFWNDNYILQLDSQKKLLFLYLLTNPATNMLGVYELNIRKISFETSIEIEALEEAFEAFANDKKAVYHESGYVILLNFLKHQNLNSNMQISAVNAFNDLPEDLKKQDFMKPVFKTLKAFGKASEGLTNPFEPIAEIEREYEREYETERERESAPSSAGKNKPTLKKIKELAKMRVMTPVEEVSENYFNLRGRDNWMRSDVHGNMIPIANWHNDMVFLYQKGALHNNRNRIVNRNGNVDTRSILEDTEALFEND